jgi:hypothetical protein
LNGSYIFPRRIFGPWRSQRIDTGKRREEKPRERLQREPPREREREREREKERERLRETYIDSHASQRHLAPAERPFCCIYQIEVRVVQKKNSLILV